MSVIQYINSKGLIITEGGCEIEQANWFSSWFKSHPEVKNALEIGFNAGVWCENALRANPNLKITSVDIGCHDYVKVAKEFIDNEFPDRHELIIGDSTLVIPTINKQFDVIFIDGGHANNIPYLDMVNCKKLAHDKTHLIIDDFGNYHGLDVLRDFEKVKNLGLIDNKYTIVGSRDATDINGRAWFVGKYAVKLAIIINSFNRSDYLHRCLGGLFNCDGLENWAIFYNQDGLPDGGYCEKTAKVANKWLDAIATKTTVERKFHTNNKNIAIRQYDAMQHAFYTYGADHIIIMEDDTVPGKGYLDTCSKLFRLAATDPDVAYISGNYTSNLPDKQKPVVKLGILHLQITWLGGHSRAKYDKIKDLHADAHKRIFIDGSYHPETPELWANWHKTLELLGLEKSGCYCQDSLLCLCYKKEGMNSLLCTTERHALPIGEVGMHFNPQFFKEQNYGNDFDWDNSALDDKHFFSDDSYMDAPGVSEQDLHIHLQNLANQGTLVLKIACTDTEAVKIGFWNDCIVKERNENILTFFKRTPEMPQRPWQDEFVKTLPTITTAVKDLPTVDPEGNVITDISGYIMDVTKFDNRRR